MKGSKYMDMAKVFKGRGKVAVLVFLDSWEEVGNIISKYGVSRVQILIPKEEKDDFGDFISVGDDFDIKGSS